ncbi:unnamed protein product [Owenia fusiformis]|uniref:Uncharacterized protein n=1 Tax=Owenia fusiformis TaxID=6347 RepID=A0A8J1TGI3_OWEFU|nr:unnamed protein product [Owenia fusiformis]
MISNTNLAISSTSISIKYFIKFVDVTNGQTTDPPTTAALTTAVPTTAALTTYAPTTAELTTDAPTTALPTTAAPTTVPTTAAPTTTAEPTNPPLDCSAGTTVNVVSAEYVSNTLYIQNGINQWYTATPNPTTGAIASWAFNLENTGYQLDIYMMMDWNMDFTYASNGDYEIHFESGAAASAKIHCSNEGWYFFDGAGNKCPGSFPMSVDSFFNKGNPGIPTGVQAGTFHQDSTHNIQYLFKDDWVYESRAAIGSTGISVFDLTATYHKDDATAPTNIFKGGIPYGITAAARLPNDLFGFFVGEHYYVYDLTTETLSGPTCVNQA